MKYIYLLFLLLVLISCHKDKPAPAGPAAVKVTTQRVAAADGQFFSEYPAVLYAVTEVELRPQVNGYIQGIHFHEGDNVRKGQQLYTIDAQQYEATYRQAQATLRVQEANLLKARQDVERFRKLDKNEAVAKQQVDYAEAAFTAAEQQVDAAREMVTSLQTNVRYTTITAPFDGTIGISQVRLGTAVSAGLTLLNTISTINPIAADITVDQHEIEDFLSLRQTLSGAKSDSTFRLAFNGKSYPSSGTISIIDRAVDSQTGSLKIRITFPNEAGKLRPGMHGTVMVVNNYSAGIRIPYKAVSEQLGEYFVYVVNEKQVVSQRKVLLGKQIGKDILVYDGLHHGDKIVTEGIQNLREGVTVAEDNQPLSLK